MIHNYKGVEDTHAYSKVVSLLREFFQNKGFIEVHTQDRLSILAACEDPTTVATFQYAGQTWPLPQTGQMWLEYELLTKPQVPGVFCVSTSFRNEQNPIPGRHKILFPMFEFESKGTIENLRNLEEELVSHLGFAKSGGFVHQTYDQLTNKYRTREISHHQESEMEKDFGSVVFLEHFPVRTSPFWNMRKSGQYAKKIDVIIAGNETIGSAERSTNPDQMRTQFETISGGGYAELLYELFGKDRVQKELNEFLSLPFFPRFGGGIGITRLIDGMKKYNLV